MRRAETSTLAFLDVMACGLGAVILILVVLKQQAPIQISHLHSNDSVSVAKTNDNVTLLQEKLDALIVQADASKSVSGKQSQVSGEISAKIVQETLVLSAAKKKSIVLDKSIEKIRATLTKINNTTLNSVVELPTITQPQYLVGLRVTGKKIIILLDRSASMTARELLQIVKFKASPVATRRSAKKWNNAFNSVWWLVSRAPTHSQLKIASFNDTIDFHAKNWVLVSDSAGLEKIKTDMKTLVPTGSTNLESAVDSAIKAGADHIYIITDGLPTASPAGPSLLGLDGCGSKLIKRNQVSGECRISLFKRTVAVAVGKPVRISIVLMPLEGDPDAAPLFSKWALSKGGILLSAARNWP